MGYLFFSFTTKSDALPFLGHPFRHLLIPTAKEFIFTFVGLVCRLSAALQGRRAAGLWLLLWLVLACSNNVGGRVK